MDDFDSYLSPYVGDHAILALLLDYDGTLAPIASHPDLAVIPMETKSVLERLARHHDVHISIISGRSVQSVKKMVGLEGEPFKSTPTLILPSKIFDVPWSLLIF